MEKLIVILLLFGFIILAHLIKHWLVRLFLFLGVAGLCWAIPGVFAGYNEWIRFALLMFGPIALIGIFLFSN